MIARAGVLLMVLGAINIVAALVHVLAGSDGAEVSGRLQTGGEVVLLGAIILVTSRATS